MAIVYLLNIQKRGAFYRRHILKMPKFDYLTEVSLQKIPSYIVWPFFINLHWERHLFFDFLKNAKIYIFFTLFTEENVPWLVYPR